MTPVTEILQESGIVPRLRTFVAAGAAAGNVTITGINLGDKLHSVLAHQVGGAVGIDSVADLTSEFAITAANTINNTGGTSSANGFLVVTYFDNPNAP
jgi:hypothetical protein